jgi:phage terminase large subunit-like protein
LRTQSELSPLDQAILTEVSARWSIIARKNQREPVGDWNFWLILAGRGFGKTRTGAEWVCKIAKEHPGTRIACIAPTAADARDIMTEGESGIIAVSPAHNKPLYEPSKRRITWKNGSMATLYSAEEPNRLRGPQHEFMWCDELAAWKYPETWDMALFGLRLGDHPRACITTTPRPTKLVKGVMQDPSTVIVRGSTYENRDNLAPSFFDTIIKKYEGTRLGRQELNAEILEDIEGALWTRDMIERSRIMCNDIPEIARIVVAIDPAVTSGDDSAETGIIVVGLGRDGFGYVMHDYSINASPLGWATRGVSAYKQYKADRIIGEANNGGDLIETIIRSVDPTVSYKKVYASHGKTIRAEPIAALYEQGKIRHVGAFPELEDQLCEWVQGDKSPDRLDALVWGLTEIMPSGSDSSRFAMSMR